MEEKNLITKIESLKEIKPNREWVFLTRENILGEKRTLLSTYTEFTKSFFKVPAFATVATLVLLGGLFVYSQSLISTNQRIANEVAEREVKQNEVKALLSTLTKLRDARTEMQKSFAGVVVSKTEKEKIEIAKDIAPLIAEMGETEEEIIESLGVMGIIMESDESSDSIYKDLASFLINDSKTRSLTEEDQLLLMEAEELFNQNYYQRALEKFIEIGKVSSTDLENIETIEIVETTTIEIIETIEEE